MPVLQPAELWSAAAATTRSAELFQPAGPQGRRHGARDDPRGGGDLPRRPGDPLLPRPADDPLPLPDQERDEPRPRAGVLRTREFIMKDSYSFDRDQEGLEANYELHREAYARIYERGGLEWYECESDVGMMGGTGAHEYMAPCAAGEDDVVLAPRLQRQPRDRQRRPAGGGAAGPTRPASCTRPGRRRSRRSPAGLGVPAGNLLKAFPVVTESRGLVMVVVRGDHRVGEIKLANALGETFRPRARGASCRGPAGFLGPQGPTSPSSTTPRSRRALRRRAPTASTTRRPRRRGRRALRHPHRRGGRHGRRHADRASSPRSRSATSSSSARATASRSARPTSTRTARSS